MALVDCPDCKHLISDKAFSCPKCGCPLKTNRPTCSVSPQSTTLYERLEDFHTSANYPALAKQGFGCLGWGIAIFCIIMILAGATTFPILGIPVSLFALFHLGRAMSRNS